MTTNPDFPLLRVAGLHKAFGNDTVLKGIDLDVVQGDRIAILGASGSGKSTFLRCLNFMEQPSAGRVALGGQWIGTERQRRDGRTDIVYNEAELTRVRQRVGMVFQQFNLFPHMTALSNVMEALCTVRGMARAEAEALARDQLARVGLADKADHYPARLSGGQKQRVAIARALAMTPELLLFDEPTSALDPELVGEVLRVIRQLAEEGNTMILVTHEMQFAHEVSHKVLFLHQGRVEEEGTPADLFGQPRSERLRLFLARTF